MVIQLWRAMIATTRLPNLKLARSIELTHGRETTCPPPPRQALLGALINPAITLCTVRVPTAVIAALSYKYFKKS